MKNSIQTALMLLLLVTASFAQSGGSFTIQQSVIGSGGGASADGANIFSVTGIGGQPLAGGPMVNTPLSIFSGFWTPAQPTIGVVAVTRQAGTAVSNSTIANVTDTESGNGGVTVTVTSANPSNGVTVSNIQNNGSGGITADVVAACGATTASFTLTATDGGGLTSTGTLNITVNANTPPTLTYNDPAAIVYGGGTTVSPATGPSDNGSITSSVLQSQGTYTGDISFNRSTGAVTISNARPVGTHTITVRSTDNCNATTDATFELMVGKRTLSVTASSHTVTFGDAAPAVTPSYAGFVLGDTAAGIDTPPSCSTAYTAGSPVAGSPYQTSCTGGLDNNYDFSFTAGTVTVNKADTSTTITNAGALAAATNVGQAYAVNWAIAVITGAGTPTGTVTVTDGTDRCTAAVAVGSCSLTSTTVGVKNITATYNGDGNFNASPPSAGVEHTVNLTIAGNIKQFNSPFAPTNLPGVSVSLAGTNAPGPVTTDAAGNFSFTGIFTGSYTITPTMAGKVFEPLTRTYPNVLDNITNANFIAFDSLTRNLRVVNGYAMPGDPVEVPIVLTALGNESRITFRLTYNEGLLDVVNVICGAASGSGCSVQHTAANGVLDVTVTPAAGTYPAGLKEVVTITFNTVANTQSQTALIFGAAGNLTSDGSGNPLQTTYTNGFVVFGQGRECDVAGRFTGDGLFRADDGDIMRQMIAGTLINQAYNEYQRADCAPFETNGDGRLDALDFQMQALHIAALVPQQTAGGPFQPQPEPPPFAGATGTDLRREMRIVSASAGTGDKVTVSVELDAEGDEVATSFTLNFDAMKLRNPVVALGRDVPAGTNLTANTEQADNGRIMLLVDSAGEFTRSTAQMVTITFDVAPTAASGPTEIAFGNDPTPAAISDKRAHSLATRYASGTVTISGPNAPGASISGRIFTPEGSGLRNARVTITDPDGLSRTVLTSSLGYYQFEGVTTGRQYSISVSSKRYRFAPRALEVSDSILEVDFIGLE